VYLVLGFRLDDGDAPGAVRVGDRTERDGDVLVGERLPVGDVLLGRLFTRRPFVEVPNGLEDLRLE
jgi:hypothetical protein